MRGQVARIEEPGILSTIQDLGRFGSRRFGVPSSGAVDAVSYVWSNRLVGNAAGAAAVEVMWGGFSIEMLEDAVVAVTGAEADVEVDGSRVETWQATEVPKSSRLSIGRIGRGHVNYISVRGGFAGDIVLGSSSTFLKGGFGGSRGTPLASGDMLTRGLATPAEPVTLGSSPLNFEKGAFRAVRGPNVDRFSADSVDRFFTQGFEISTESDRVGYRLMGDGSLGFKEAYRDLVSFAVHPGMVQVPSAGDPILLMCDCQTTGGYPVIGQVFQPDLSLLAQKEPMDMVRFEEAGQADALEAIGGFLDWVQG